MQDAGCKRQETRDKRQEARDKRQEARDKRQEARGKGQETRDKRATGVAMSDAALQALSDLRGLRGALSEW